MTRLGLQLSPSFTPAETILCRATSLGPLSRAAEDLICGPNNLDSWRAGAELVKEQDPGLPATFLTSGWAAHVRHLPDGRRQIIALVLPGDALGLRLPPRPPTSCTTIALTDVQTLSLGRLQRVLASGSDPDNPLSEIATVAAALDEICLIDQVMRLGRQTAYERMCHLFLELLRRLKVVGLADDGHIPMPLTQEVLADVTGLSTVHVNRVLQQLRKDGLVELKHGSLGLLDPAKIAAIADYRTPRASAP